MSQLVECHSSLSITNLPQPSLDVKHFTKLRSLPFFVIIYTMVDIYNQFKDFKNFEVVFHNKENELQKIFCNIKSIESGSLIISANNQKNKNIVAEIGCDLKLYIYTDMGIYSANSKVILVSKGMINTEYVISYPTDSKHSQRREYFRADIPVKFSLTVFPNENIEDCVVINSTTRNICGKGMSYISNKPFFDYIALGVELFFDEKMVKTSAQLVYTKPIIINGQTKFIHAFTFTDISKTNIEFIIKKCFFHQLDLRKTKI